MFSLLFLFLVLFYTGTVDAVNEKICGCCVRNKSVIYSLLTRLVFLRRFEDPKITLQVVRVFQHC